MRTAQRVPKRSSKLGSIAGISGTVTLCLVAAGEWTRRQEALVSYARVPSAHIGAPVHAGGSTGYGSAGRPAEQEIKSPIQQ